MTRAVELADENTTLTHDLQDAESTHRLLEDDALSTAQTLSHRLHHTRSKLAQCEGDLSEQHHMYHLVRDERDRLHGELVHTRHQLSRLTHEHTRLITQHAPMEEQLRKGQEDTKTYLDRINHLTLSLQEAEGEKMQLSDDGEALRKTIVELKAEKEALNSTLAQVREEHEAASQGKQFYAAETEKLGRLKGEVEQERDYYKEEAAKHQSQAAAMEQERDLYREKSAELEREKQLVEQSRSFLGDDVAKLQAQLRQVQQERDYFTDQLNQVIQLLDLLKTKPSSTPSTPMQVSRPRAKTQSPNQLDGTSFAGDRAGTAAVREGCAAAGAGFL
ncbi:hypothetical protein E2C01_034506 [Portunus trituberculatus]|uniref:Uncharacterized protein n=1 Tax=Portunus trituberculatus TaxID=210409 RepID=A0A5B7F1S7_PORTR|nr:hypothetical protein [Portunus trituberculatus]